MPGMIHADDIQITHFREPIFPGHAVVAVLRITCKKVIPDGSLFLDQRGVANAIQDAIDYCKNEIMREVYGTTENAAMHAFEPYTIQSHAVFDAGGQSILLIQDDENSLDSARRMVACTNTCAGIPANDLPRMRMLWFEHQKLLAACDRREESHAIVDSSLDDKVTRATQ